MRGDNLWVEFLGKVWGLGYIEYSWRVSFGCGRVISFIEVVGKEMKKEIDLNIFWGD